ncbi:MAG: hypothetical protein SOT10_02890 [Oscillospiraceae bacterium]|nr:hypothetical protein [Oscillospiraceae bacterium]
MKFTFLTAEIMLMRSTGTIIKLLYNKDMGGARKIGSAHLQLFANLISTFRVYRKT